MICVKDSKLPTRKLVSPSSSGMTSSGTSFHRKRITTTDEDGFTKMAMFGNSSHQSGDRRLTDSHADFS